MANWIWILIAIAAVVVVALIAMAARQSRTTALRQRFGPEYDRAVEAQGRQAGEADLRERERQRARLDIAPLPENTRVRFAGEWRDLQARFVDRPADAVVAADGLVYRVMEARGYPMMDFDAQADLVSVDYAEVVENYRYAHGVREQVREQQAATEELREALLRYRSLFDELLRAEDEQAEMAAVRAPGPAGQRDAADSDLAPRRVDAYGGVDAYGSPAVRPADETLADEIPVGEIPAEESPAGESEVPDERA